MTKPINEVVLTGKDTPLARRLRMTKKGRDHLAGDDSGYMPTPGKKGVVQRGRKSNNNKPKRKKKKKILTNSKVVIDTSVVSEEYKEALEFVVLNDGLPVNAESVRDIKDKLALQSVVSRMLTYHLDGWVEKDGKIENGSISVNPTLWTVKEGRLYDRNGGRPSSFEWLYNLKALLESAISEEVHRIEGILNERRK